MTICDLMKRLATDGSRGQQRSIGEIVGGKDPFIGCQFGLPRSTMLGAIDGLDRNPDRYAPC